MLKGKEALAHFERVGRALAKSEPAEPLPRTPDEVIDRMLAIDPNSGMGSKDPMGGDLASHIAHVKFFSAWVEKRG